MVWAVVANKKMFWYLHVRITEDLVPRGTNPSGDTQKYGYVRTAY